MSDEPRDLELSRLLRAPRAKVWRAWSDPILLAQWWCPKPWKTEVKAFEFRNGGAFHTYMTGPEGGVSDNPGCFLDVTPMSRIVSTSMLTGGWRPHSPWLAMTAIFTLADEDGGTRFIARAMHTSQADSDKHREMGFEHGWGIMIAQLEQAAMALGG